MRPGNIIFNTILTQVFLYGLTMRIINHRLDFYDPVHPKGPFLTSEQTETRDVPMPLILKYFMELDGSYSHIPFKINIFQPYEIVFRNYFFNNIQGDESVHASVFRFYQGNSIQKRARLHYL